MIDGDIEFQPLIRKLISRKELTEGEIETSIDLISTDQVSHASIVAFLVALTMKRETANELRYLIKSVKERSIRLTPNVNSSIVDICGTGGDSINTPNISTACSPSSIRRAVLVWRNMETNQCQGYVAAQISWNMWALTSTPPLRLCCPP